MSKKSATPTPEISWGPAFVITDGTPDSIVGRVFEIIEACGLPQKQEDSVKQLIRKTVWETIHTSSVAITRERHTEIRGLFYEELEKVTPRGSKNPVI